MPINSRNFEYVVLDMIESANRNFKTNTLNLGGVSGSGGGLGGPPGGFIGTLPQYRVSYDMSEDSTDYTPASGMSLLDNLNHIRRRIAVLEPSIQHQYNEDLTNQIPSSGLSIGRVYMSGTTRLYYNGLRKIPTVHYVEVSGFSSVDILFTASSGDYLVVDYDYLGSV